VPDTIILELDQRSLHCPALYDAKDALMVRVGLQYIAFCIAEIISSLGEGIKMDLEALGGRQGRRRRAHQKLQTPPSSPTSPESTISWN